MAPKKSKSKPTSKKSVAEEKAQLELELEKRRQELWKILSDGEKRVREVYQEVLDEAEVFADKHGLAFEAPNPLRDEIGQQYVTQAELDRETAEMVANGQDPNDYRVWRRYKSVGWNWMRSYC